jgi:hypothetical protein
MNMIAINASPRKNWNTATLLQNALEGAASKGADTELVHLWFFTRGAAVNGSGIPAGTAIPQKTRHVKGRTS